MFFETSVAKHEVVSWMYSPRKTNFGNWRQVEMCADNSWVGGMRLKIEPAQGEYEDDTALNGIQLYCVNMDWILSGHISSARGPWGTYGSSKYCTQGFAHGYKLRAQNGQGAGDDVGAVDFQLQCTNFNGGISYVINSYYRHRLNWGTWSAEQNCPSKTAVCGITTQVEPGQGRGDDTALNNVALACCKIPDPAESCKIETKWETVVVCPNATLKCVTNLTTGIERDKNLSKFTAFYEQLGFVVDFQFVQKSLNDKARGVINGHSLQSLIGETKIQRNKMSIEIDCEGLIQQLVPICGTYKVYTKQYRCVPNGDRGEFMIYTLVIDLTNLKTKN